MSYHEVDCFHCLRDMSKFKHTHEGIHDMFLFPHGCPPCSGVTEKDVALAESECEFCPKITVVLPMDDDDA